MPYNDTRLIHDADAHIMETPTWLRDHADPAFRDRLPILEYRSGNELRQTGNPDEQQQDLAASFDRLRRTHHSDDYLANEATEIMVRKNFAATGSFLASDRPRALDLLGFSSQLVFNTFHNTRLHDFEHSGDVDLAYAAAEAHNRGMLEFCAVDPRLLATCYVPLVDPQRAVATAHDVIARGASALLIASGCPPAFSPSHLDLFALWGLAQDAEVPVVFHVGGTGDLIDPHYFINGLPIPHDFHGGDENFRSVDYMGIPGPPAQTLATLIFDGVLEQFADLRIGVIEQGAIWVPSWLRQMESAFDAFRATRIDCRNCRCGRATTSTAKCASPPTPPKTWAGSSKRAGRTWSCSRRTIPTSKGAAGRSSASRPRSATQMKRPVGPSTSTTSAS